MQIVMIQDSQVQLKTMDMDTVMDMGRVKIIMDIVMNRMDMDTVMTIMIMITVMEWDIWERVSNSVFQNKSQRHTNQLNKSLSCHCLLSLALLHLLITSLLSTQQSHQLPNLMIKLKTQTCKKMLLM